MNVTPIGINSNVNNNLGKKRLNNQSVSLQSTTDTFQKSEALDKKKAVSFEGLMSEAEKAAAKLKLRNLDDEAAKIRQALREAEVTAEAKTEKIVEEESSSDTSYDPFNSFFYTNSMGYNY